MNISEALPSIAEVAVTLVGFAAVFRAFRGLSVDPHSGARTLAVIEVGLVLVLLCYVPLLLIEAGLEEVPAYRLTAGLTALYWIRWLTVLYRIRNEVHATPGIYRFVVVLNILIFLINLASATALLDRPEILYFGSAVAILAYVSLSFLAQYKAEASWLTESPHSDA